MAKDVDRGKHISVLVEQAFPTCILVSYKEEGKTFRGVLLHESSQTVTRLESPVCDCFQLVVTDSLSDGRMHDYTIALYVPYNGHCQTVFFVISGYVYAQMTLLFTISKVITKAPVTKYWIPIGVTSNFTASRASISKAMNNDDSNLCLTSARAVTCESNGPPITAPRVSTRSSKMMSQDQGATPNLITPVNKIRGLVKTLAPRKRQTTKTEGSPNPVTEEPIEPQKSPPQKMTLMKSLKRKRTSSNTSPKKLKNEETSEDPTLPRKLSKLVPIVKLTRTAGSPNNYVAFLAEKNGNIDQETDVKSNESTSHKHNTRYKGKKRTSAESNDEMKTSDLQNEHDMSLTNGEPLVEVYTQRASTPTNMLDENTKGKHCNVNKAYAKRGIQPRNHNKEMRVGDIVWGKVHGHPWWPGRILGILCHATESEAGFVKVAWYGSTTTSDISCSLLLTFEENFKQLYKKQKLGAYRRAVREAQQDLQVIPDQVLQA